MPFPDSHPTFNFQNHSCSLPGKGEASAHFAGLCVPVLTLCVRDAWMLLLGHIHMDLSVENSGSR